MQIRGFEQKLFCNSSTREGGQKDIKRPRRRRYRAQQVKHLRLSLYPQPRRLIMFSRVLAVLPLAVLAVANSHLNARDQCSNGTAQCCQMLTVSPNVSSRC